MRTPHSQSQLSDSELLTEFLEVSRAYYGQSSEHMTTAEALYRLRPVCACDLVRLATNARQLRDRIIYGRNYRPNRKVS